MPPLSPFVLTQRRISEPPSPEVYMSPIVPETPSAEDITRHMEQSRVTMEPPLTPPPTRRIVSNARDGFPQLEIVSLPRSPRRERVGSSPTTRPTVRGETSGTEAVRATDNVIKRLEDVSMFGFPSRLSQLS